jgi:hypothetical protein
MSDLVFVVSAATLFSFEIAAAESRIVTAFFIELKKISPKFCPIIEIMA